MSIFINRPFAIILRAFPTRAIRLSSLGASESSEREISKLSNFAMATHWTGTWKKRLHETNLNAHHPSTWRYSMHLSQNIGCFHWPGETSAGKRALKSCDIWKSPGCLPGPCFALGRLHSFRVWQIRHDSAAGSDFKLCYAAPALLGCKCCWMENKFSFTKKS